MSDNKLKVELQGDNASLIAALEQAQQKIDKLTNKGKDDVDGLGKAFEHLSMKSLAGAVIGFTTLAGAAEKALEIIADGIKTMIEIIPKAIENTEKLQNSFEQLNQTAGLSVEEFNKWAVAIKLAGGNTDDLNTLVLGKSKGIAKNSEVLIENKIASDKAALSQMSLADYVAKVTDKVNQLSTEEEKNQLLMAAFGKSGMSWANTLQKINQFKEESVKIAINTHLMDEQTLTDAEKLEQAKARLAVQEEVLQRRIAGSTMAMATKIATMKLEVIEASNLESEARGRVEAGKLIAVQEEQILEGETVMVTNWAATVEKMKEANIVEAAGIAARQKAEREQKIKENPVVFKSKEEIEAEKKAAEEARKEAERLAKEKAAAIVSLHDLTKRFRDDDIKTGENATVEQKKQLALLEAKAKLENDIKSVDKAQEKAPGLAGLMAAAEAKLAAEKTYSDQVIKINRDAAAENQKITDDANKKALDEKNRVLDIQLQSQLKAIDYEVDAKIEEITFQRLLNNISDEQELRMLKAVNDKKLIEENKAINARLELRKKEATQDLVAQEKLQNELKASQLKYIADNRKLQQAQYIEARKKSPMAGIADASKDYIKIAKNNFANFKNYATNVMNATEDGIANALKGMITDQMSFGEAMKGVWTSITDAVISAIAKMVAQWVVAAAAQLIFGEATEETENTKATAALDTASAETWSAYAGIPFVGPALALAQQALILTSFAAAKAANKGATAFATGGMVTAPTLGLIGEAGEPELIAPKQDFMQVTKDLVASGAAMYGSIVQSQAKVNGYTASSSNYAPSTSQIVNNKNKQSGHTFNISGVIGDKKVLGDFLKTTINNHTRTYGSAI